LVELSVVIPTRNRADILAETLERLIDQETEFSFEVLVVDDGSRDSTFAMARSLARRTTVPLSAVRQAPRGPAAARNTGIAAAAGAVCLFIGDDMWPRADLVERHGRFHLSRPEPEAALLGHVEWAPESRPSPFMEWLNTGIQFDFDQILDADNVSGSCFYTANVSAKTAFLRAHGGFDEAFPHAAFEDLELGLRLERAGLRLAYDAAAVVEHWHPTDLAAALRRMRRLGGSAMILHDRFPDWPLPRRPGARHLARAVLLTTLNVVGQVGSTRLRHATWRFLCHEAFREGCWGVEPLHDEQLRIGRRLARLAGRDPATRTSTEGTPDPARRRSSSCSPTFESDKC
jgi:glycosyltransferase involved in cell wall biosynthesis